MYDEVYSRVLYPPPSCLDAAYERHAIDQGHIFEVNNLFPENKEYYKSLHEFKCRSECSSG